MTRRQQVVIILLVWWRLARGDQLVRQGGKRQGATFSGSQVVDVVATRWGAEGTLMDGEAPGFHEFVVLRSRRLVGFACLLCGDLATAEDLTQEALARAWVRWGRVRRTDDPAVYVRQVIINLVRTSSRRRWHGEVPVHAVPNGAVEPDLALGVVMAAAVRGALATLPVRQRAVVVLRFYEDLTEAETARILGCSTGTVKSQTAKAFAKLRQVPELLELLGRETANGLA